MAISDQGERVDAYQVLDGTRPEVVVMMAVDSGSEVHTAPVTFPWNVEQFDKTLICLSDVQSNKLQVYGTALLNYGVHDVSGNVIEIGTRFLVSNTVKFVLSVGELGRHGWRKLWEPCRVCHTKLGVKFLWRARLELYGEAPWKMVATTSTGSATPSPSGRELGSPGASGALLPPLAESLPVPMDAVPKNVSLRPVLSAWSPVAALRDRLKALNGAVYGTKNELWKRLCEYEARAEQQLRERQWIEARKNELIQGARPKFGMLQANLRIRWKLSDMKLRTFRQCRGASRVAWARVEMRLIFAVRQCEKRLRSRSTSVSSVKMQLSTTWQNLFLKTPGRRFCVQ